MAAEKRLRIGVIGCGEIAYTATGPAIRQMLAAGPDLPRGVRDGRFCYLFDLFPTLCEWTGLAIPPTAEGRSLGVSRNTSAGGREALYLAYRELQRGVRTSRYKLIEYVVGGRRTRTPLFDLQRDPHEMHDRSADPESQETLVELRQTLAGLRDEWGDRESPWGRTFWEGYERPAL